MKIIKKKNRARNIMTNYYTMQKKRNILSGKCDTVTESIELLRIKVLQSALTKLRH